MERVMILYGFLAEARLKAVSDVHSSDCEMHLTCMYREHFLRVTNPVP